MPETRAGAALQSWLAENERSQRWLADHLRHEGERLHVGTVSAWIAGKLTPATIFALRIEELCGIPVRWWAEPVPSLDEDRSPFGLPREVA